MRIVAVVGFRNSAIGAPLATHRLLDHLESLGHEVVRVRDTRVDPFDEADIAVVSAGGLEGPTLLAKQHGAKVVALVHSTLRQRVVDLADLIVWNTVADRADRPGIVCHPVTPLDEYRTTPGDRVTLVNLSESKGGELFGRIAGAMPDTEFLGVEGGYGRQLIPRLPNVDVIPTTTNMRDDVYARTRVLLMPSASESWGMVGVEAMVSGVPVIAHPTPGLTESLGDAGIFVDRSDVHSWISAIERLHDPDEWQTASDAALARAGELDPQRPLDLFAAAIEKLTKPKIATPPPTPPAAAVIGTGRSGTGYMSKLLGFGHEAWWNPKGRRQADLPGDCSWLALPDIEAGNHPGPVLHVTRHPVDVVRSLVGIGFFAGTDPRDPDGLFRRFAVENLPAADVSDPTVAAVEWWAGWNERCAAVADLTVKLEDVTEGDPDTLDALADLFGLKNPPATNVPTDTNGRARSKTTAKRIWSLLDGRADQFGYGPDLEV